jgi:glycosyltransferase involved in cell wall biosynthesis
VGFARQARRLDNPLNGPKQQEDPAVPRAGEGGAGRAGAGRTAARRTRGRRVGAGLVGAGKLGGSRVGSGEISAREGGALDLLIVATKAPWPPLDGGRLLLLLTLRGLAAAGVRPVLVAPVDPRRFALDAVAGELGRWCEPRLVPAHPAGRLASAARSLVRHEPASIVRHSLAAVRREVERALARGRVDLLHAEQLQALPQTAPGRRLGLPVVLRAQNVESDLWAAAGGGRLLAAQARRLAAWEGRAVAAADLTLAVSAADAERLALLARLAYRARSTSASGPGQAPHPRVEVLPPPFPERLDPPGEPLPGTPAVVVLGSGGWLPNRDALSWFLAEVWPAVRRALPAARLHVFGVSPAGAGEAAAPAGEAAAAPGEAAAPASDPTLPADSAARARANDSALAAGLAPEPATLPARPATLPGRPATFPARPTAGSPAPAAFDPASGVHRHPAPADSATAFARGSIHAVPLRFGSGVRMKVLEAWARGVPVVATPEAVAGLAVEEGREALVAREPAALAAAIARLHHEPGLARSLVEAGRRALRLRHDPEQTTRRLLAAYEGVLGRRAK